MQVARIFTSETCLAVIAVLSPTPTRGASVSADGLGLHARCGSWPPLARNPRVFAYEVAVHALFGATLGMLLSRGD